MKQTPAISPTHKSLATLLLLLLPLTALAQTLPSSRPAPSTTWSSPTFTIGLTSDGLPTSLSNPTDPLHMNFIRDTGPAWGLPVSKEQNKLTSWDPPTLLSSTDHSNQLLFTHNNLSLTLTQSLSPDNHFLQRYTLTNTSDAPLTLPVGDFGIRIPLPDNYPSATIALTQRCNVHLWTADNSAWINAVRMNGAAPHLGLLLTDGSLAAYSITDRPQNSNDRGTFVLHPPTLTLAPKQSTTFAWTLFWNSDWQDFFHQALQSTNFIQLAADHYTLTLGQTLHLSAKSASPLDSAILTLNGNPLAAKIENHQLTADITPTTLGDQTIQLTLNHQSTWLRAFVTIDPLKLIAARVNFIIDHQQQHLPGNTDNAFLAYDNQTHKIILEKSNDHNAGRERVGMGVLLALYLPRCTDPQLKAKITASLNAYYTFVTTHLQDASGKVFNNADDPKQRLYNYPWVAQLHLDMYHDFNNPQYLDACVRTIKALYANGGQRFYPVGLPITDLLTTLTAAHRAPDHDALLALFRAHADRIIATGLNMPKSEVNYEQSIVAPACQILLETYLATSDPKYHAAAQPFLTALNAFNGQQPDHHLNDLSIRHWDDYWFGKEKLYGDTFPHYWSTLTADVLNDQAKSDPAQTPTLLPRAQNILANNLSLFSPDGAASCAYVYPLTINNHPAQFYDPWANDQDWALVYYLLLTPQ